jgi:shikimate kinase
VNILLMGLRGSGKTTIGRLLAQRAGRRFVDLDDLALARFPETTVTAVWQAHGEPAWREAEALALRQVLAGSEAIIALGGGTPMIDDARALIEQAQAEGAATVIYLRCTTAEMSRRLSADAGDRPSLTGADPVAEIQAVLEAREPTFRALADHELDVTEISAEEAARSIHVLTCSNPAH